MTKSKHFRAHVVRRDSLSIPSDTYFTTYVHLLEPWVLERKYVKDTGEDLWICLLKLIQNEFPTLGVREFTDQDDETSLWWFQENDSYELAKSVIKRLDNFVETCVLPHKVPALVHLVSESLVNRQAFAQAIMNHQRKHGYYKTDSVIYTYFRDIQM